MPVPHDGVGQDQRQTPDQAPDQAVRVRVGLGRRFELAGESYHSGDELDVPADVAANLIRASLVLPLDDAAGALLAASEPPQAPQAQTGTPRPSQAPPEPPQAPSGACCADCEPPASKPGQRGYQVCPTSGCPCHDEGAPLTRDSAQPAW